jgi:ribosomal protein L32
VEEVLWKIPYCPMCGGVKHNERVCEYCEGNNEIPMHRCPRANEGGNAASLLPFYYAYRESRGLAWPDGRGRLFQPVKLIMAFGILTHHFNLHKWE